MIKEREKCWWPVKIVCKAGEKTQNDGLPPFDQWQSVGSWTLLVCILWSTIGWKMDSQGHTGYRYHTDISILWAHRVISDCIWLIMNFCVEKYFLDCWKPPPQLISAKSRIYKRSWYDFLMTDRFSVGSSDRHNIGSHPVQFDIFGLLLYQWTGARHWKPSINL